MLYHSLILLLVYSFYYYACFLSDHYDLYLYDFMIHNMVAYDENVESDGGEILTAFAQIL